MFRSIKIKFGLLVTAITSISIIAISSLLLIQERSALTQEVIQRGVAIAQNLALSASGPLSQDQRHILYRLLHIAEENAGVVEAFFIDPHKIIVAHKDSKREDKTFEEPKTGVEAPGWKPAGSSKPDKKHPTQIRSRRSAFYLFEIKEAVMPPGGGDTPIGWFYLSIDKDLVINKTLATVTRHVAIIASGFLALGILASLLMAAQMVKPIHLVSDGAKRIGRGDLDYKIKVKSKDEIGQLAQTFNEMTTKLKTAQQDLLEKERMKHELQIAQRIQQSLLPKDVPALPGFSIAHYYQATTEVGGDYYDFLSVGEQGGVGFVIADVSGKGVPAALLMAITKSTLRTQAVTSLSPAVVLTKTNRALYHEMQRGMFVTMFYAILDPATGVANCACAGHNPALLVRHAKANWIRPGGMPLGHDAGPRFEEKISETPIELAPNDVLIIYSDGVTEAMNVWGEEFGEMRLGQVVTAHAASDAATIMQSIKDELYGFVGGQPQSDDITIVVLKREGLALSGVEGVST